ncbi:ABC transporter ATP-binding protein [Paenibacillus montanisoli]|uniref:Spermidine/putrescine ABC transporter ATP-binding protein n=1 Tax=Paenibacillus montanisoli TaxID=2081970 RepID=A0A328UB37_9BACL|nr:ABC transporter ATP-binding protein [Paenibacillus montanisoli]RAP77494.1 spermidine/putrescine ABC transporter ATP-binding protein [Paenibacillus montanisoli]
MLPAVEASNITHVYVNENGASLALDQIALTVADGEFVSLVGPSGCGKTTLLSIIAGLIRPTGGTVRIQGQPVTGPTSKIGYMLQQDFLFPWRNIRENVTIGLEVMGKLTRETKEYALHLLDELGLGHAALKYPGELSGGMRQRAALARTLATEPDILFLDEPFSSLDFHTKLQLENLIFQTLKDRSKTSLLVTHDIAEAIAMSDRIIVLQPNPGRIGSEIIIPPYLAEALPIDAREQDGFQEWFRLVRKEFTSMEKRR